MNPYRDLRKVRWLDIFWIDSFVSGVPCFKCASLSQRSFLADILRDRVLVLFLGLVHDPSRAPGLSNSGSALRFPRILRRFLGRSSSGV